MEKKDIEDFKEIVGDDTNITISFSDSRNINTSYDGGIVILKDDGIYSIRRNIDASQDEFPIEIIKNEYSQIQSLTSIVSRKKAIEIFKKFEGDLTKMEKLRLYQILSYVDTIEVRKED